MNRRDFLKIAGLSLFAPQMFAVGEANWDRVLVLLELKGGNDGLNTVIPFTDKNYYTLRPRLSINKEQVLPISEHIGFNPMLEKLMPLWKNKELAIIQGMGYPEPNRSHFRSIEIWETASDSNIFLSEGWIARLFAKVNPPADFIADGIILGQDDTGPLAGGNMRNIAMQNPKQFIQQAKRIQDIAKTTNNDALKHVLKVQNDVYNAASLLQKKLQQTPEIKNDFPTSPVGQQLKTAAQLLISKTPVAVIKVSHGGFDTHSNQRNNHDRLLQQLGEALSAFRNCMVNAGLWNNVLLMTYSEFGRRAAENGSGGTDHGTAAPHFMMGGKVKGGLYGKHPSLTELVNGDLRYNIDYRSVYMTVAQNWWNMNTDFLPSKDYTILECL